MRRFVTHEYAMSQRKKPDPYYVKPKADGVYWIYDHRLRTMYPMIHDDNRWHDLNFESMQQKEIVEGPLPYPTQAQIDGQAGYFEAVRQKTLAETGYDPAWPMVPLKFPYPKPAPDAVPYGMIDGFYWIRLAGEDDRDPPTFVQAHEGYWAGMAMNPYPWEHDQLESPPLILFGPVPKPSRDRVKYLKPGALKN